MSYEIMLMDCITRNCTIHSTHKDEASAISSFERIISTFMDYQPYVEQVSGWIVIGFDDSEMFDYVIMFKNAPRYYQTTVNRIVEKMVERFEVDSVS